MRRDAIHKQPLKIFIKEHLAIADQLLQGQLWSILHTHLDGDDVGLIELQKLLA